MKDTNMLNTVLNTKKISGLLFDYGGTIDTNGIHWFKVFYKAYTDEEIILDKETLRKAYIFGEQEMERNSHLVLPEHTFKDNLQQKVIYQIDYLLQKKLIEKISNGRVNKIIDYCYDFAYQNVREQSKVLAKLAEKYPLGLVSNFYGNLQSVLNDFGISSYFQTIVESAKVGVRKPDPKIFRLGIKALELPAEKIAVIGDSYKNDIAPAHQLGCITIWLKGIGWDSEEDNTKTADFVIGNLQELIANEE